MIDPQIQKFLYWAPRAPRLGYALMGAQAARESYARAVLTLDVAPTVMHDVHDHPLELPGRRITVRQYVAFEHGWAQPQPAASALRARDRGIPLALQRLIYPGLASCPDTESHQRLACGYLLDADEIPWFFSNYLRGDVDRLREPGEAVQCTVFDGMIHAFFQHGGFAPAARRAHAAAGAAQRAAFGIEE